MGLPRTKEIVMLIYWDQLSHALDFCTHSWFGLPVQISQAIHPSGVGELVTDLSGKKKALTGPSAGPRKSVYGKCAFKPLPRHSGQVEYVAQPKKD